MFLAILGYLIGLVLVHVIFYLVIAPLHQKFAEKIGKKYDPKKNRYY